MNDKHWQHVRRQGWWEGLRAVVQFFSSPAAVATLVFFLAYRQGWLMAGYMWLWVAFDVGLIVVWLYAVKVAREPEPEGLR